MAVLHPRATAGPITTTINRCFHFVIRTRVFQRSGLTVFSGPLLLVAHATCWATLLLFGVALIVWPQLGNGIIENGSETTDDSFLTAIYYSGFSITTLGVGDFVPRSGWTKLVTITSSSLGFSFFTLVLAYVLSIYSALARRNQFACEIDYRTQRTGDTLAYLQPHILADDWTLLNQDLYSIASNLAELLESHHFYPALHYFRFADRRYAMSQMLRFCLEVATVLRVMQDTQESTTSINREPVDRLWHASLQMLSDTEKHFVVCKSHDSPDEKQLANQLILRVH
ncbi:MAG: two pore domain potassium channel family protein [Phycisphaera sp. RhM]|nr:two pore domain potassium channel family protein [Phycisphaera sp. RhM]